MSTDIFERVHWKEDGGTKICFTIGEVAAMYKISESTLRYWEKETVLSPRKSKKGTRYYHKKDMLLVDKLYYLVKEKGFTVEAAARQLDDKDVDEEIELLDKMRLIKQRLDELVSHCDTLLKRSD